MNRHEFDCSNIRDVAGSLPLIEACDMVRDGSLRLATPFRYADGSNIDVFRDSDLARLGSLSDVVAYPAEADKLRLALAA